MFVCVVLLSKSNVCVCCLVICPMFVCVVLLSKFQCLCVLPCYLSPMFVCVVLLSKSNVCVCCLVI